MIAANHSGLKRVLYSRKILEYGAKIDSRERLMIQEARSLKDEQWWELEHKWRSHEQEHYIYLKKKAGV